MINISFVVNEINLEKDKYHTIQCDHQSKKNKIKINLKTEKKKKKEFNVNKNLAGSYFNYIRICKIMNSSKELLHGIIMIYITLCLYVKN